MAPASTLRRDLAWGLALGTLAGGISLAASRPQALWPLLLLAPAPALWWIARGPNRWVLALLAAVILLPPVPLPGGNSGPHPAVLLAIVGLWAGFARLGEWQVRWTPLSAALCLLLFALLTSAPLAAFYSGWEAGLGSFARVALFAIAVYVFFYLSRGPGRHWVPEQLVRLLFWAGLVAGVFACFDFAFQLPAPARFAEQYVWLPDGVLRRAQGLFYEATALGSFCVFLLVMIACIAALKLWRPLRLPMLWLLAAGVVLLAALIFSFSRSAMASLGVALAALALLERSRLRSTLKVVRWSVVPAVCAVAGVMLVGYLIPSFLPAYFDRLWFSGQFLLSSPGVVLAPRMEGWRFLLDAVAERPWHGIFGIGYKTLPYSGFLGRPVVADNMYLSLLVEVGWTGLLAMLLFSAAALHRTYCLATRESGLRRFLGVWMFCFWCGQMVQMMSGDILTYWRLLPLYFSALALADREA